MAKPHAGSQALLILTPLSVPEPEFIIPSPHSSSTGRERQQNLLTVPILLPGPGDAVTSAGAAGRRLALAALRVSRSLFDASSNQI